MDTSWVILANASSADIYSVTSKASPEAIKPVIKLEHPESRKKRQDLVTDKPGHYQTRETARGSYSQHTDPKEVEFAKFAKEIAEFLEKNWQEKNYQHLIVVAAPHFYGLLRKNFTDSLLKSIKKVVEKEIILNNEHEVKSYIYDILHS